MNTFAHDLFGNTTLDILIFDARFFFLLLDAWCFVDAIIRPEVEDKDVFWISSVVFESPAKPKHTCRVKAGGFDTPVNRVFSTID